MRPSFAGLLVLLPTVVGAQHAAIRCPVVNGISVTTDSGSPSPPRAGRPTGRALIDTTWSFDVRELRWDRPTYAASIGLGFSGSASALRSTGTTTAPDSAAQRNWSVCAAVGIGMRDATLLLRGARGTVHVRADAAALQRIAGQLPDTTSRLRR